MFGLVISKLPGGHGHVVHLYGRRAAVAVFVNGALYA